MRVSLFHDILPLIRVVSYFEQTRRRYWYDARLRRASFIYEDEEDGSLHHSIRITLFPLPRTISLPPFHIQPPLSAFHRYFASVFSAHFPKCRATIGLLSTFISHYASALRAPYWFISKKARGSAQWWRLRRRPIASRKLMMRSAISDVHLPSVRFIIFPAIIDTYIAPAHRWHSPRQLTRTIVLDTGIFTVSLGLMMAGPHWLDTTDMALWAIRIPLWYTFSFRLLFYGGGYYASGMAAFLYQILCIDARRIFLAIFLLTIASWFMLLIDIFITAFHRWVNMPSGFTTTPQRPSSKRRWKFISSAGWYWGNIQGFGLGYIFAKTFHYRFSVTWMQLQPLRWITPSAKAFDFHCSGISLPLWLHSALSSMRARYGWLILPPRSFADRAFHALFKRYFAPSMRRRSAYDAIYYTTDEGAFLRSIFRHAKKVYGRNSPVITIYHFISFSQSKRYGCGTLLMIVDIGAH